MNEEGKPTPIVLQHRLIERQMAYLIMTGIKRSWVKLHEANDAETKAILKYEADKNCGVEPIYYPEPVDNEDLRALRQAAHSQDIGEVTQEYNLRERELLLISMNDFYGIKPKEEKREVITIGGRTKKQVKKEQARSKSKKERQLLAKEEKQPEKAKQGSKKQQISEPDNEEVKCLTGPSSSLTGSKSKKKGKIPIINLQKANRKKKTIKKWTAPTQQKPKHIEIYDGTDSELEML